MVFGFRVALGSNRSSASSTSFCRAARYSFIVSAQITLGDRHTPPHSECQARDLQSRRSLAPLVLVRIDVTLNPVNGLCRVSFFNDIFRAKLFFDVKLENRIEDLIGWERVLICLIQFLLCTRRFGDRVREDN